VESLIGDANLQPHIHDTTIAVTEGLHKYIYKVYYKRHCRLPSNICLEELLDQDPYLRSDVLVMRKGTKGGVVNMRERDTILADWLMKRYVNPQHDRRQTLLTHLADLQLLIYSELDAPFLPHLIILDAATMMSLRMRTKTWIVLTPKKTPLTSKS